MADTFEGKICKHINSGNFYMIHSLGKVKIKDKWSESVNYIDLQSADKNSSGLIYTRLRQEFFPKFDITVGLSDYEEWAGLRVTSPDWTNIVLNKNN